MKDFEGKIILVTGAGRPDGIGAASARLAAERGARVILTDILDGGYAISESIPGSIYLHLDVTQEDDWVSAIATIRKLGGLHGVVNNAAYYRPTPLMDTSVEEFERHMRVNQLGTFLGMKFAAPLMANSGGGSIVNMSSTAGLRGSPSFAYCGTKWAIRGMSKTAAATFAPLGIRVNSVHPGPISTELITSNSPQQRAERIKHVPLKREGTAEEVAEMIVFLLSDKCAFVTGSEFSIDGGVLL